MIIKARHSADVVLCKTMEENTRGKDFVVGDIHGCVDLLMQKLDDIGFDEQNDRLFSVGDLVDRGPDSIGSLELLRKPWFHACLANHEAMMLCYFGAYSSSCHSPADFFRNGGTWALNNESDEAGANLSDLLERVAQLPLAYHVQGKRPFNVCHADISQYRDVDLIEYNNKKIRRSDADNMVWSRDVLYAISKNPKEAKIGEKTVAIDSAQPFLDGLSLTYCGHTVVRKLVLTQSHLHIDTGAYQLVTRGQYDFDMTVIENTATQEALDARP